MNKKSQLRLGQRLRDERLTHNWSQQELADLLGTTPVTISRWENGVSAPSPYFRLKLEKLFGKSLEALEAQPEEVVVAEEEQLANDLSSSDVDVSAPVSELSLDTDTSPAASEPVLRTKDVASPHQVSPDHDTAEVSTGEGASPKPLLPRKRRISRRNAILLLIGGATVTVAGGVWLIETASSRTSTPAPPTMTTRYVYKPGGYNVNFVAWSPRGTFLACANGDKTVQILEAATGYVKMVYRKHTGYTECVTWSPDETRVASASGDATVQVWKPATGEYTFSYTGHTGSVYCVGWSPDGTRIASGGKDTTVQVWDAFTGQNITTYRGHTKGVWNVSWSPDGRNIASGGEDGAIQVWDARTAQKSQTFVYQGPQGRVNEIDWSPDGHHIASSHLDATVRIWDMLTGSAELTYTGHATSVLTARWSRNGVYIASGDQDGMVHIWNASTAKSIFNYKKHTEEVYEVSWSPDSKQIAIAVADQTMDVCEMVF